MAKTSDIIGGFPVISDNCAGCGKPLLIENAWMTDGCPCNTPLGVNSMNETRWRLLMELQQKQSHEVEALAKFKAYVHRRLDEAGVPADPDSPHKAEGCRIGGRLDFVLNPWVPVTERKPNDGKRVLICDERNEVERGVWDGAYWWDDGSNQASPTHWMPLPEPPPSPVASGPGGAERSGR
jgi:hypothetical protein